MDSTPARARSKGQRDGNGARTGAAPGEMAQALLDNLRYRQAKLPEHATRNDWYMALAYTIRDRMLDNYITTVDAITGSRPAKVVAYLSAEFLTGPHLGNSLVNLGLWDTAKEAVTSVGQDLAALLEHEEEPGLGNGGLGRLAACYMDSLATLSVPAIGYGIRYEFGIFDQAIRDGWQVELTDKWLRFGNPWEIVRSETSYDVPFGGRTDWYQDERGEHRVRWVPDRVVKGVAYDTPVPGYRVPSTNLLRLWKAEATESFDFDSVQRRRLLRRRRREGRVGNDLQGALSERRARGRQAAAPAAAVLLRLLLAAGHDPPPSRPRRTARRSRRVVGGSAQRHPPRRRHRRADAAARRHTRHGVGSGLADHPADVRLHEPHAPGGSAREMAARALRRAPAPPSRDRPRDQPAAARRRPAAAPRGRGAGPPPVDHRRDGRAVRPHGQPRLGRQPRHQRRGRAPYRAAQADGA